MSESFVLDLTFVKNDNHKTILSTNSRIDNATLNVETINNINLSNKIALKMSSKLERIFTILILSHDNITKIYIEMLSFDKSNDSKNSFMISQLSHNDLTRIYTKIFSFNKSSLIDISRFFDTSQSIIAHFIINSYIYQSRIRILYVNSTKIDIDEKYKKFLVDHNICKITNINSCNIIYVEYDKSLKTSNNVIMIVLLEKNIITNK